MRISDWSSDVCSSDLLVEFFLFGIGGGTFAIARYLNSAAHPHHEQQRCQRHANRDRNSQVYENRESKSQQQQAPVAIRHAQELKETVVLAHPPGHHEQDRRQCGQRYEGHERSEEHTSELQSLMRISYAVFCLKKTTQYHNTQRINQ